MRGLVSGEIRDELLVRSCGALVDQGNGFKYMSEKGGKILNVTELGSAINIYIGSLRVPCEIRFWNGWSMVTDKITLTN
jgi:hypothetical protein